MRRPPRCSPPALYSLPLAATRAPLPRWREPCRNRLVRPRSVCSDARDDHEPDTATAAAARICPSDEPDQRDGRLQAHRGPNAAVFTGGGQELELNGHRSRMPAESASALPFGGRLPTGRPRWSRRCRLPASDRYPCIRRPRHRPSRHRISRPAGRGGHREPTPTSRCAPPWLLSIRTPDRCQDRPPASP